MKKGISLIVLVITIIVMIILAASVVITLNNSNIITKANDATQKTNTSQVEQLANIAWAEGYLEKLRGDALNSYVQEAMKNYTDNYTITVTDKGVIVTEGVTKKINEYGFYYDVPYEDRSEEVNGYLYYMVCKSNNTIECYSTNITTGEKYFDNIMEYTPSKNKLTIEEDYVILFEDEGKTLIDEDYRYIYSTETYRDIYYGEKYYSVDMNGYLIIRQDNTIEIYDYKNNLLETIPGTELTKKSHWFDDKDGEMLLLVSMDGRMVYNDNITAKLLDTTEDGLIAFELCCYFDDTCVTYYAEPGMTWGDWIASEYNTIGATDSGYDRVNNVTCKCGTKENMRWPDSTLVKLDEMIIPNVKYEISHK